MTASLFDPAVVDGMTEFVYPRHELSAEDQALRRGRITASIAAMIAEESEFGGMLRAYRIVRGLERWSGNRSTELGHIYEPLAGALYQYRHRAKGVRLFQPGTRVHPELDWLAATLDYLAVFPDGRLRIVECKRTDERNRRQWGAVGTSQCPPGYRIQVAVQLAVWRSVLGDALTGATFAVLIGNEDLREYEVEYVPEFEANTIALLERFRLEHVLPRVAPRDEDRRLYAATVWPEATEDLRIIDEEHETAAWFDELKKAARERARANAAYEEAAGQLSLLIGPSEGVVQNGEKVTLKKRKGAKERVLHVPPRWGQLGGKEEQDDATHAAA